MNQQNPPLECNVLVTGCRGCGKSSLCKRFVLEDTVFPNTGRDLYSRLLTVSDYANNTILLNMHMEIRNQSRHLYFNIPREKDVWILCFAKNHNNEWITVRDTYVPQLKRRLKDNISDKIIVLCATKSDIEQKTNNDIDIDEKHIQDSDSFISYKEITQFANNEKLFFIETSSINGDGVDELFQYIGQQFVNRKINPEIETQKAPFFLHYNLLFDILAVSVSVADLLTDILIVIEYYQKGRIIFFILSIIIIVLAQLAYSLAFVTLFSPRDNGLCCNIVNFIFCLPFAPLLSYVIYIIENYPNSWFVQTFLMVWLGFDIEKTVVDDKKSQIEQWIEDKFRKHCGFILESFIEAFPNSIIQMIAIVYYNEADLIAIVSIIISMLSVSTKALIFSRSINPKIFLYNWISAVTDFFSIFFTISWVFYNQSITSFTDLFTNLNIIGSIWVYKILIGICPLVIIGGAGLAVIIYIGWVSDFYSENQKKLTKRRLWFKICVLSVFLIIGIIICYVIGVCFAILMLEITCFILPALLSYSYIEYFPDSSAKDYDFWNTIFLFIMDNTSKRDKKLRIISCLRTFSSPSSERLYEFSKLHTFIRSEETKFKSLEPFSNISYNRIKSELAKSKQCSDPYFWGKIFNQFLRPVKDDFDHFTDNSNTAGARCFSLVSMTACICIFYVLTPIYMLSRTINILFPLIIIIYIGYYDLWNEIDAFQYVMMSVYVAFFIILISLATYVLPLYHCMWHLGFGKWPKNTDKERKRYPFMLKQINRYYDECRFIKLRQDILAAFVTKDVAQMIYEYLPNELCTL